MKIGKQLPSAPKPFSKDETGGRSTPARSGEIRLASPFHGSSEVADTLLHQQFRTFINDVMPRLTPMCVVVGMSFSEIDKTNAAAKEMEVDPYLLYQLTMLLLVAKDPEKNIGSTHVNLILLRICIWAQFNVSSEKESNLLKLALQQVPAARGDTSSFESFLKSPALRVEPWEHNPDGTVRTIMIVHSNTRITLNIPLKID